MEYVEETTDKISPPNFVTNIEPSNELLAAIDDLVSSAVTTKELYETVRRKAEHEGIPGFLLRSLVKDVLRKRGLTEAQIQYRLPKEQSTVRSAETHEDRIEQSSINESDDIDETHDQRSENIITDKVKVSMPEYKTVTNAQEYDYEANREENKIRFDLKREIESLRQQLDDKVGINELLKGEIEASKNQKFESRLIDVEELNKQLRIENEQLRHALTKHSFETAAVAKEKADPELVQNLTNYIKQLEEVNADRYKQIQELQQEIEAFSHIDRVVEHQPLDLDLTDKGGFLGQFFAYRGKKVKVIHDGTTIKNIVPEVIK